VSIAIAHVEIVLRLGHETGRPPPCKWYLAVVSFVESSVFPIPPDAMLIPMTLAKPHKAWVYATICTIASVLGGLAGYAIGMFLFDTLGQWILDFYNLADKFVDFQDKFNEWGLPIVFFAGLTPFPYKVITLMSGVTEMSLPYSLPPLWSRAACAFTWSAGCCGGWASRCAPSSRNTWAG
jgi:membrane protein YqaA with SNARE-associated domain